MKCAWGTVGTFCVHATLLLQWLVLEHEAGHHLESYSSTVYLLHNILDGESARNVRDVLASKKHAFIRKKLPMRSGTALSLRELRGARATPLHGARSTSPSTTRTRSAPPRRAPMAVRPGSMR